jgi:hypothetical protein
VELILMPVFKLAPIDIRANDEKWGASNLKEVVWAEARDEMEARHLVERATLQMQDVKPGEKLNIFSPWLDDVVTLCLADREAKPPPLGHLVTAGGKAIKL